jgi:bicarbonate transport system substrate-binding protein
MAKFFSTRRRFLLTAGASAIGAAALKGCSSAPSTPASPAAESSPAAGGAASPAAAGGGALETDTVRLGYIPIFESAPLVIAKQKGFFEKHGLKNAQVIKQSAWGAARDNVEIGSAGGGIDGGQWQMPMPHLISEGLITKGNVKIPMYVMLQTSTQGNGIAIANKRADGTELLGKGFGLNPEGAAAFIKQLKAQGNPFTAAYTFPQANQELWIRYWLGSGGINPDEDIKLIAVPAAQTVANMKVGTMDGFSTGDPWPFRILADKIGFMAALTAQIWPGHPEEYLAMRADWVDKHPNAAKAILMAVMEAQQWCDDPANRTEMAKLLSGRQFFNVAQDILMPPLEGRYELGDGKAAVNDIKLGPLYWKDSVGSVSYPYKSHDLWFLTENIRWGMLPAETDTKAIVERVNREDLWKEAAKSLGVAAADIPTDTSRGVETFFDGVKFDPANPTEYLKSLKVKKVSV